MHIRDRIKDFRRVKASLLQPHPNNWRAHPTAQQDALRGVLAEIGYAGALLARELQDGTLQLIDGHLRAETTPDAEVPVLVLDLDEREAAKLLALYDPLAGMAEANEDVLAELHLSEGHCMNVTASHPALIAHCRRSPRWKTVGVKKTGSHDSRQFIKNYRGSTGRAVVSFEYVGGEGLGIGD